MERSDTLADDPFGGREPTSGHDRLTGLPWDASYQDGPAPWDIGQPQPATVRLASEGGLIGSVLDVGCGAGENALYVAGLGFPVLGVDVAETALAIARGKADGRGISAMFAAADALHLERLGRKFQTVLDSGLFHTFDGDERQEYVASLASVTEHDGTLYVLCFSDHGPDTGPHPDSQEELWAVFNANTGWNVVAIEPERIQTRFHDDAGAVRHSQTDLVVTTGLVASPRSHAAHFLPDLILIELGWMPDVPGVHDQTDAPTNDRKDRPEESAGIGYRPDHDDQRVHEDVHQQMRHEVVTLLQSLDRPLTHRIGHHTQITSHCRLTCLSPPRLETSSKAAQSR